MLPTLHRVKELLSLPQLFTRRGTQLPNPSEKLPSGRDVEATTCCDENHRLCDVDGDDAKCVGHSLAPALVDKRDRSECFRARDDRCLPRIKPGDGVGLGGGQTNELRLDLEEDVLTVRSGTWTAWILVQDLGSHRRRHRQPELVEQEPYEPNPNGDGPERGVDDCIVTANIGHPL